MLHVKDHPTASLFQSNRCRNVAAAEQHSKCGRRKVGILHGGKGQRNLPASCVIVVALLQQEAFLRYGDMGFVKTIDGDDRIAGLGCPAGQESGNVDLNGNGWSVALQSGEQLSRS